MYPNDCHNAYYPGEGPYPGRYMNLPVPIGALKETSDSIRYPNYIVTGHNGGLPFQAPNRPLLPSDYFKPYGPNTPQNFPGYANYPEYYNPVPVGHLPPAPHPGYPPPMPHFSSVNAFAPLPEIQTLWEKIGILTTVNEQDNSILNLYRRPIAPHQDLFEYSVQDKDGFIIRLSTTKYLEDGDIVPQVTGKESLGAWKVNNYVNNKYVWV